MPRTKGATSATTTATASQIQPGFASTVSPAMATRARPAIWCTSTVVRSHHGVNGAICSWVT
jgi:hypothetical protein